MGRRFKLENLPKYAREKISSIEWADDLIDDLIGLVYLKKGYCFEWDGSHCEGFSSREDLLEIIRSGFKCLSIS